MLPRTIRPLQWLTGMQLYLCGTSNFCVLEHRTQENFVVVFAIVNQPSSSTRFQSSFFPLFFSTQRFWYKLVVSSFSFPPLIQPHISASFSLTFLKNNYTHPLPIFTSISSLPYSELPKLSFAHPLMNTSYLLLLKIYHSSYLTIPRTKLEQFHNAHPPMITPNPLLHFTHHSLD